MSDITGGVDPAAPEFHEVSTGKYEVVAIGRFSSKVQRPDGSLAFRDTIANHLAFDIVAELERARLDNGSTTFLTMLKCCNQRDALQVLLDAAKESHAAFVELYDAQRAVLHNLEDAIAARDKAGGVRYEDLAPSRPPHDYRINKVMGGWYFLAPDEEPENIYDFVVAEGRMLYSSMEEATAAAWKHSDGRPGVGGSVFNDQGPLLRWPNRCTDGARDAAVVTEEKVAGWSVPASQWEITVRPSEKPLYRATRHLVYGEVARSTEETMHAESLSLIRMKVLNWFRRQGLPAACVPDDSPGSVLETWL